MKITKDKLIDFLVYWTPLIMIFAYVLSPNVIRHCETVNKFWLYSMVYLIGPNTALGYWRFSKLKDNRKRTSEVILGNFFAAALILAIGPRL
jgi:hypothetical protein